MKFLTLSKKQLQELAKLNQKKYRDLQQRYLISGLNAVQGALETSDIEPQAVLLRQDNKDILSQINISTDVPVFIIEAKDFERISDEKSPQGVALIMKKPFVSIRDFRASQLSLYLEEINDPGNLGTIMRSALWFGIDTIILSSGSVDPYHPKVVRSSAGSLVHLKIYELQEFNQLDEIINKQNIECVGTIVKGGSLPEKIKIPAKPLMLCFGSEAHGLSTDMKNKCNQFCTLARKGKGESLNLAVSVALCLYALNKS